MHKRNVKDLRKNIGLIGIHLCTTDQQIRPKTLDFFPLLPDNTFKAFHTHLIENLCKSMELARLQGFLRSRVVLLEIIERKICWQHLQTMIFHLLCIIVIGAYLHLVTSILQAPGEVCEGKNLASGAECEDKDLAAMVTKLLNGRRKLLCLRHRRGSSGSVSCIGVICTKFTNVFAGSPLVSVFTLERCIWHHSRGIWRRADDACCRCNTSR
mmetsp:Transcript_55303/g.103943  ORF Transcript_55303/g.103943 Transcript_55303/m.103943 type:complete len:212 (-) Transcript_55303:589-1224(-)